MILAPLKPIDRGQRQSQHSPGRKLRAEIYTLALPLIQTAASFPYFLLALPAGSAGDIFDRRRLILFSEIWMMAVALILATLSMVGLTTPWLLLTLTSALSAGDAFEAPTWRATLPELVSKDDLAAASALNGIEFNLARAVGPATAGMIIPVAGVSTAFIANVILFCGVIFVVVRWKRPIRKQSAPAETLTEATVAAALLSCRKIECSPW